MNAGRRERENVTAERILLVDDDSNILDGYRRSLGREFHVETAMGGQEGLKLATDKGPYAVVISDMRMPGMDGLQFLAKIKSDWPDTVRVMLTGNTDAETATNAINEGSIFRFLNKPCSAEAMAKTLTAALVQYRLVTAEKQLLEHTLSGSIQVLTEVLSMIHPAAFGRAERARRYIHQIVTAMNLGNPWQYEVAAMLSQLGCVTLPPKIVDAVYKGDKLSAAEQKQYDAHPRVAHDLISKIPRLEPIAWMIEHQNDTLVDFDSASSQPIAIRRGAHILRLTLAYETLTHNGASRTEAAHRLSRQNTNFSPDFFRALATLDPNGEEGEVRKCRIQDLTPGMIIQQEIRLDNGELLVSKGQEVTITLLVRLRNTNDRRVVGTEVAVSVPKTTLAFVKGAP
jgi:CheY-like chemotaxis protein